MSKGHSWC